MPVIKELIRTEADGTLSFGNYELDKKSKVEDFEIDGDIYKVKTYNEITKLEKNGMFVYESVPGTAVNNLKFTDKEVAFSVEGKEDAQITLELDESTEYKVLIDDTNVGKMKTNLSGKLVLSVELSSGSSSDIKVIRL
ncbi:MAG: endosialidase [Lachnospiraceae bacterium]|uniref:endosialidase n=1 Tax=Falcatimonas sp. MSJ-15 TaxID=2841515 RepID=UPI001C108BB6|nr:endosialidase [Falcatimonas sp. MSJ-15]MBQ5734008.1 endosialidase [Lachnospiraceae bacterium]MBU5470733.1 endosialidase [Falcatimonas sp. MSJ-15]MEE0958480.1 endosialidase [Lachnospiraceae bacterium]